MILNLVNDDWSSKRVGLTALRSLRTPTVTDGARAKTYTSALAQAQELWDSAGRVTTLSSPILRYYAMMQIALAIDAASSLGNQAWRPSGGHGLKVEITPDKPEWDLGDVFVSEKGADGSAQKLGQALGSPVLAERCTLTSLIASLPGQSLLNSRTHNEPGALELVSSISNMPAPALLLSGFRDGEFADVSRIGEAPVDCESTFDALAATYPALASIPRTATATRADVWDAGEVRLSVTWQEDFLMVHRRWPQFFDVGAWDGVVADDERTVLPVIAGNSRVQHPFLTWHIVLYVLSTLARYRSDRWRFLLDPDRSPEAVLLSELADHDSEDALYYAHRCIREFARQADQESD